MITLRFGFFFCVLLCLISCKALAEEPATALKLQRGLIPASAESTDPAPVFIKADRIQGYQDKEIEASGDAEMRQRGKAIFADWMMYFYETDEIFAKGNVRIVHFGDILEGAALRLNLGNDTGQIERPGYRLFENGARGSADLLELEGRYKYHMREASYTTCPVGTDDWVLRVKDLEIDHARLVGVAHDASIVFKGVPILYTPWMDFPIGDRRKSGVLAPVVGSTNKGGAEVTVPYYWNIASNRDATISPRIMTKRGVQLNNEFRYLEPNYFGEAHFDLLPNDKVSDRDRYGLNLKHTHNFRNGWSGALNLQKVSDNNYFRDLGTQISVTAQTTLPREGYLSYGAGWGAFTARLQRFQTLQDPAAPVIPPYDRVPQLTLNAARQNVYGADLSLASEFVDFSHPSQVSGRRFTVYPSMAYPLLAAGAYVTPKIGIHNTWYSLEQSTVAGQDASRTLPIFSLDSGVFFEREWTLFGESLQQTLEPRVYFVYIPFRNQSQLPNFDSAEAEFNFAQIFTENRFSGGDRIGDADQVTLALTSRLLEPASGNELFRLSAGQRLQFKKPQIILNPATPLETRSDFLAAVTARLTQRWLFDAGTQYNPNQYRTEKIRADLRYQPETGKVLNLGYRFSRDTLKQTDISSQWPLSSRWYGLGRINYSFQDHRLLEGLGGLEYNGGCWVLRLVAQRFATATGVSSFGFFVQLELNGLSKIGPDPLGALRQSIPGYTKINPPSSEPRPYLIP